MNIGAVIITYNPNIKVLQENIDALKKQVSHILIVDNCSTNIDSIVKIINYDKMSIIREDENVGIAKATNDGIEKLKLFGMDWVLTMDQDSKIPTGMIERYSKHIGENTGLLAAIQKPVNEMKLNGQPMVCSDTGVLIYQNILDKARKIIASGSLIRISAWEEVQGFDNYLFIDAVDYDFNMKLLQYGFDVVQLDVIMKHSLGTPVKKKILGRTIYSFNHSSFRKYYIARNSIIMAKRYSNYKQELLLLLNYFIKILLVEDTKKGKIISFSRGMYDGINYNFSIRRNK